MIWYTSILSPNAKQNFFEIKKKSNNSLYWHQVKIEEEEKKMAKTCCDIVIVIKRLSNYGKKAVKISNFAGVLAYKNLPQKFKSL